MRYLIAALFWLSGSAAALELNRTLSTVESRVPDAQMLRNLNTVDTVVLPPSTNATTCVVSVRMQLAQCPLDANVQLSRGAACWCNFSNQPSIQGVAQ